MNEQKKGKEKNLLITGSTGFLGEELIEQLLRKTDSNLYLLTRDKNGQSFDTRTIEDKRIIPVSGNMLSGNIFTNQHEREELENIIDEIWHLAAITDFKESNRNKTIALNYGGTKNLINVLNSFRRNIPFNYISTCYTCGDITEPKTYLEKPSNGTIPKNPYELSKQETEKLVINSGIPYRIFRPSIIIASEAGRIDTKTIYGFFTGIMIGKMNFLREQGVPKQEIANKIMEKVSMPVPIIGDASVKKNLIPVDYVVNMMLEIAEMESSLGKIFHLANPSSSDMETLLKSASDILNIEGLHFTKGKNTGNQSLPTYAQKMNATLGIYRDYMMMSDPSFDMANTRAHLNNGVIDTIPINDLLFHKKDYGFFFEKQYGNKFT